MHEIQLPLSTITFQVPEGSTLSTETAAPAQDGGTETTDTEGGGTAQSPFGSLPFLLLIGAFFWFVLIAPERKRRKKHEALLTQLKKGDEVITNAGLYGKVVQIQDQIVTLQVADGVRMRFSLQAVQGLTGPEPDAEDEKK